MTAGLEVESAQSPSVTASLNIKEFLERFKPRLTTPECESLDVALQSIEKRRGYCVVFYCDFMDVYESGFIALERVAKCNPDPRVKYEAYTYAFMQNLHALIDCLPYALNIAIRCTPNIEHKSIGWNPKTIESYDQESFYGELVALWDDEKFCMLAGLVNRTKHKHLVRIRNDFGKLFFEDFIYRHNGQDRPASEIEVKAFMIDCHDHLMLKAIGVYSSIFRSLPNSRPAV